MKKFCSLALVLALLLGLSVSVFAAETTEDTLNGTGNSQIPVTGVYTTDTNEDKVYHITVTWEGMNFTYKGADKVWDTDAHDYVSQGDAVGWGNDVGTITVTNHSNAFITLDCGYAPNESFKDIGMDFTYGRYAPSEDPIGFVYSAEVGN